MKTSSDVSNIFPALIKIQDEMSNVAKTSDGYGYKYAPLDAIVDHLRPINAKHDVAYIQTTTTLEDGRIGVTTRVIHKSGEWVEDTMTAPLSKLAKMNEYQVAGSIITYFRRYALSAMFGIASEEDTDVNIKQPNSGNNYQKSQQKPQGQTADKNQNGVSFKQIGFFKAKINEAQKAKNQAVINALHEASINGQTIDNVTYQQVDIIKGILGLK